MKLRKLVCSVVSAVMFVTGIGVMSLSADAKIGGFVKNDDGGYYDDDGNYRYDDGSYFDEDGNFHYSDGSYRDEDGNLHNEDGSFVDDSLRQAGLVGDFITRLYSLALGRTPDSNGLEQWKAVLSEKRGTGISVAYGFIYSNEFQNRDVSNEEYVELMYQMFFGREADAAGKEGWVNVLNSMGRAEGRLDVFNGFANSNEFFELCNSYGITAGTFIPGEDVDRVAKVNLFVDRLYSTVLDRQCDKGGMNDWTSRLISGTITGAEAGYGFFFSQEYLNSSHNFIRDLYRAFMGREADDAGYGAWTAESSRGASREHIFNGFTQSQEFSNICSEYGILRGGPVDEPAGTTYVQSGPDVLTVWTTSNEIKEMAEAVQSTVPVNYVVVDASSFIPALDAALAVGGEDAPDIIFVDQAYLDHILNNGHTVPISSVGITDSELSDMFPYTLDQGSVDGSVYALTYYICPSVVFYNRSLAQRTLGVSSPEEVAPYFASWDSFLDTARTVNNNSDGTVKVISGPDDIFNAYTSRRTHGWDNMPVNSSSELWGVYDLAFTLVDENLTFQTGQWLEAWQENTCNGTVLSYWGPDWLARYTMQADPAFSTDNPYAGDWGAVRGPEDWNWGGMYAAVTDYCDNNELAARFMRSVVMDPNAAASVHTIPNSRSTLAAWASDPAHNEAMLGGQNPYGLYAQVAEGITNPPAGPDDSMCNAFFYDSISMYAYGEIDSAQTAFEIAMNNIRENVG